MTDTRTQTPSAPARPATRYSDLLTRPPTSAEHPTPATDPDPALVDGLLDQVAGLASNVVISRSNDDQDWMVGIYDLHFGDNSRVAYGYGPDLSTAIDRALSHTQDWTG